LSIDSITALSFDAVSLNIVCSLIASCSSKMEVVKHIPFFDNNLLFSITIAEEGLLVKMNTSRGFSLPRIVNNEFKRIRKEV
jgi:hypothetical protein